MWGCYGTGLFHWQNFREVAMHQCCVVMESMILGAFKAACSILSIKRTLILRWPLARQFWRNQCDTAHFSAAWLSCTVHRDRSTRVHGSVYISPSYKVSKAVLLSLTHTSFLTFPPYRNDGQLSRSWGSYVGILCVYTCTLSSWLYD